MHRPRGSGVMEKAGCGVRKHGLVLAHPGRASPSYLFPYERRTFQMRQGTSRLLPALRTNPPERPNNIIISATTLYKSLQREREREKQRIKQQSPLCGRPSVNASRDPIVFSCLLTLYFLSLHLLYMLELASVLFGCHPLKRFQKHLSVFFFCCN